MIGRRKVTGLLLAALLLLTACGNNATTSKQQPEDRSPAFAARKVTWAQGKTLHYGKQTFAMPEDVDKLWRSSYGFIVSMHPRRDMNAESTVVFFDGHRTTRLKGTPDDIAISPDGRYAGWIDFHGPKRPMGRLAEVVVTDLRTGEELFRNHDDMGGAKDDLTDLYEDAEVHFLGFDDHYAYWDTPTGDEQLKKARIGDWKVEPAGRRGPMGDDLVDGEPYDSLVGYRTAMAEDGRVSRTGDGPTGFRSPEKRWCLTSGTTGAVRVVDCRTAATATPRYPAKFVYFGGWQDPDRFYVMSLPKDDFMEDPTEVDRSTGVLASCRLPSGSCHVLRPLTATDSVVFAIGPSDDL